MKRLLSKLKSFLLHKQIHQEQSRKKQWKRVRYHLSNLPPIRVVQSLRGLLQRFRQPLQTTKMSTLYQNSKQ
jgi:hypothetical protein